MSKRWLRWFALGALALGLGVLVVRMWLPDLLRARPAAAIAATPDDPATLYRLASLAYASGRPLSDPDYARIEASLARLPMAADPFALAAIRATRRGDTARATRLLEEARDRNPRHRLARLLLLERYVRDNRPDDAGVELVAINRLVPEASRLTLGAMTAMALDPRARGALVRAMRGDPGTDPLLARLVQQGAPIDTILLLAAGRPPGREAVDFPWRQPLLERLIRDGRYEQARTLWGRFSGLSPTQLGTGVFNANFTRVAALPPFNWRTAASGIGAVEITPRNSLTIDYFGRQSGELLAQLATLRPGRYRLSFTAEGKADASSSRLVWYVRCAEPGRTADQGRTLLSAVIDGIRGAAATRSATFTVPDGGCRAQWLSLEALATDFSAAQNLEILRLSVAPIGSGDR